MAETPDITPERNGAAVSPRVLTAGCILIFAAASTFVFRGAWNPLNTIEGADAALWVPMFVRTWTEGLFVPRWFPHFLAGIAQQFQFMSHGLPLMLTLSPHRLHGFQYMLDTFLAGAFMFAFLRSQRTGHFGSLVGGLSFQLGNSLLTSARQGVLWRFDTACWVPLFLLFFSRILDDHPRRARNCVFAGATLGLQFLGGEVQVAYYVCLLALAYFAVESAGQLWSSRRVEPISESLKAAGKRLVWATLCAIVGIVFAAEVFSSYAAFARRNENVGVRSESDNWRFATEFSFAPEETLALALTGEVFDDELSSRNYAGRRIARITDDYIGIVVILFAFIALLGGGRRRYFFACAAVAALIISFGRYFPLPYRLVYALPAMKGLRNPHKWLFITTVCVPILAGMGADYWRSAPATKNRKIVGAIVGFTALMVGLALLSPLITGAGSRGIGLPPAVRRPLAFLIVASLACLLGRAMNVGESRAFRIVLPSVVVVLLAGDLIVNAAKFISYYDYREKYIEDNLVEWVRSKPGPFRVKLWSESPYLRDVATEVLPYHGVDVVDVIMSRRPGRYSEVLRAAREGRLPIKRLFQIFNVRYILSSTPVSQGDVSMSHVATFKSERAAASSGECYVYELDDFLPRVYVVGEFAVSETENIIDGIAEPDFDLHRAVMLEKQPGVVAVTGGPEWTLNHFSHSPHQVSAHVTVDRPAIMVLQDFMDENWHAHVDTEEVEILRANYLMRAVVVPEGTHSVVFTFKPPMLGYAVTLVAWIAIVSIIALMCVRETLSAYRGGRGKAI